MLLTVLLRHRLAKRVLCALMVALMTATLASCNNSKNADSATQPTTEVTVAGTADETPKLNYERPFEFDQPVTQVLWEGSGEKVRKGEWVLLRMYAEDAQSGEEIRNDFASLPQAYLFTPDSIGSELYNALVDLPFGSRVMHTSRAKGITQVLVVDLLPAWSTADPRPVDAGLPTVAYGPSGEPQVTVTEKLKKPNELVVQQLKSGSGAQVQEKAQVLVQIVGTTWSKSKAFYSTWGKDAGPVHFKVGADKVIAGLDQALVDAPVGSQLLIVVPPELGFGQTDSELAKETLVYIVDVLAATTVPE